MVNEGRAFIRLGVRDQENVIAILRSVEKEGERLGERVARGALEGAPPLTRGWTR